MYKCWFLACFCASQRQQRLKTELTIADTDCPVANHWTDRDQIWNTYADSSGNGHRLNKINLSSAKGYLKGVRGVTHTKMWERCQTSGPIGTTFGTRMHIHLGMDIIMLKINPWYPRGMAYLEEVMGSQIQKCGKEVIGNKFGTRNSKMKQNFFQNNNCTFS